MNQFIIIKIIIIKWIANLDGEVKGNRSKPKTTMPIIIREFLLKYQSGSFLASNNFSEILLELLNQSVDC